MDRHEPKVQAQTQDTTEVSAVRRFVNSVGNYLRPVGTKLTAAAAAGVLTITLAGCGEQAKGETPEPSPTSSSAPIETEEPVVPIEEMTIPETLVPFETMPLAEFIALPIEERLPYIDWLTRDEEEIADLWHAASGLAGDEYPGDITPNSSNQDIENARSYDMRSAFVSHFNTNGIDGSSVIYDEETAQKILSGAFADTTTPYYQRWTGELKSFYETANYIPNPQGAVDFGLLTGIDLAAASDEANTTEVVNGVEYVARTMPIIASTGKEMNFTYIYVDYTGFDGEPTGKFVLLRENEQ